MWTKVLILLQKEVHPIVTGPHHLPKGRLGTSGNDWFQKYFCLYLLLHQIFSSRDLQGTIDFQKMYHNQTNLSGWLFTFLFHLFDSDCCISSLATLSGLHFPFIQLVTLINQTKHRYRLSQRLSWYFFLFCASELDSSWKLILLLNDSPLLECLPIKQRPSPPGTFHILIVKFPYLIIRFYYRAIK